MIQMRIKSKETDKKFHNHEEIHFLKCLSNRIIQLIVSYFIIMAFLTFENIKREKWMRNWWQMIKWWIGNEWNYYLQCNWIQAQDEKHKVIFTLQFTLFSIGIWITFVDHIQHQLAYDSWDIYKVENMSSLTL